MKKFATLAVIGLAAVATLGAEEKAAVAVAAAPAPVTCKPETCKFAPEEQEFCNKLNPTNQATFKAMTMEQRVQVKKMAKDMDPNKAVEMVAKPEKK
jgi:hypothetical protein